MVAIVVTKFALGNNRSNTFNVKHNVGEVNMSDQTKIRNPVYLKSKECTIFHSLKDKSPAAAAATVSTPAASI